MKLTDSALQFQTPDPTVSISRSGSLYTLKRALGLGCTWEIDLALRTTGAASIHVLAGSRISGAVTATLHNGSSVYEYAAALDDAGFLGNSHGGDNETGFTVSVDGSPATVSDGATLSGASVRVVRTSVISSARKLADAVVDYEMTRDGLTLDIDIDFVAAASRGVAYVGMLPVDDAVNQARIDGSVLATLSANDDATALGPWTCRSVWFWQPTTGKAGTAMLLDAAREMRVFDRADTINKAYAFLPSGTTVTPADRWQYRVRYLADHFDSTAATVLDRTLN